MLENIKQAKNWEDRYRFIIQAGKHLPQPYPDELAQMQSIQEIGRASCRERVLRLV